MLELWLMLSSLMLSYHLLSTSAVCFISSSLVCNKAFLGTDWQLETVLRVRYKQRAKLCSNALLDFKKA